ncbi:MAG: hypothetical protein JW703_02100 [Candidatus Diapherotrites archaeon]|nr:hypothetical protein [Candidatus Diapherotrites archaeon]
MPKKPRVFLDVGTGYPYPKHLHDLAKKHSNIKFTAVDWQQHEHWMAGLREHSKKELKKYKQQLKENPDNEQAKTEIKKFNSILKILASEKEVNSKLVEFKKKNLLAELYEREDNSINFLNSDFVFVEHWDQWDRDFIRDFARIASKKMKKNGRWFITEYKDSSMNSFIKGLLEFNGFEVTIKPYTKKPRTAQTFKEQFEKTPLVQITAIKRKQK